MNDLSKDNYQRENYNVGIYCRLSNDDRETGESNSISNQKAILTKYVMDQGWNIVDIYVDDGYSGLNFDRPGFKRLLEDIKDKKVSIVLTKDMSRLGRDYIQVGFYIEKFFPENKVRFVAINDNIDTGNKDSNDMTPFKAVINDMYSKDISKKVRSVFNMKRQEGKFIGPFAAYGYEKDMNDKNHLTIDHNVASVVKRIFQMYLSGHGFTVIAKRLNSEGIPAPSSYKNKKYKGYSVAKGRIGKWSHASVKSILKNPVYCGSMAQNKYKKVNYKSSKIEAVDQKDWIIVKDMHESIVTEEEFKNVQLLMNKKNKNFTGAKKSPKLFSGFAFCADCGQYMTYYKTQAGSIYLICSGYKRFGKEHCSRHPILEDKLEEMILDDFRKMVQKFANKDKLKEKAEKVVNKKKTSLKIYEDELATIEKRLDDIKVCKLHSKLHYRE